MKKITLFFVALFLAITSSINAQFITTEWQKSASTSNNLNFIDATCRGMGFGSVNSQKILVIPSRKAITGLRILDAATGDSIAYLPCTGDLFASAALAVNDAAVTVDGKILASNCIIGTGNPTTNVFRIYKWDSFATTATPSIILKYTVLDNTARFGDHFTVTGSITGGTAKLYAAGAVAIAGKAPILCFSMIPDPDNAGSFIFDGANPTVFSNAITANSTVPSIAFLPNGKALFKGNAATGIGGYMSLLNADGTLVGNTAANILFPTLGCSVKSIGMIGSSAYIALFRSGSAGAGECADIIQIDNNDLSVHTLKGSTPSLGSNSNTAMYGGRVCVEVTPAAAYIYVLGTNNGLGKYKVALTGLNTAVVNTTIPTVNISVKNKSIYIQGVTATAFEVFNTLGQKIKSVSNSNEIEMGNLQGVFIVKVEVAGVVVKTSKVSIR